MKPGRAINRQMVQTMPEQAERDGRNFVLNEVFKDELRWGGFWQPRRDDSAFPHILLWIVSLGFSILQKLLTSDLIAPRFLFKSDFP